MRSGEGRGILRPGLMGYSQGLSGFLSKRSAPPRLVEEGGCAKLSAAGMIFFMNFAQMRVGDVGVDLRRVDGGMTQELLDAADIGPVI